MANNIDERIVEMRFDNKDFEKGVSNTIDSLDKLKKGLDFEDSVKGFDELDKAAGKVDLNPLEKSVEAVKVKFNALEVIAITALSRITNQAMEAGEKLVKSFTLDPIASGFDKYESKVASVQRILNSSSKNTMEGVQAALDKIEWFTNETSYQYDQMVSTLGSFAASGIELQDATNMIVGIADAAAISGVNAKDASHAMLGFQRAISSGYLSLGIWNSYLKTAGMQSQVFIDKCIEMGLKTGTLRKNMEGVAVTAKGTTVDLASFASTLNEKWLDAETLTETTKAFSIASDELYAIMQNEDFDMVGDAIDKYGDKLDQFSLKAFKAGQETKTWGDTVEYVRGTVAQGWSKTFELIFGNYETATKFFSSIVEDMYTIFVAGGDARNEFLEAWATGVRWDEEAGEYFEARQGVQVAFLNGLINTMRAIGEIVSKVRDKIFDLIPDSVLDTVMDLTLMFHQWSINFAESVGVEKIARSLEFVNDKADDVLNTVSEGGEAASNVIGAIGKVAEPTAEILEEVNALAKAVIRGDYGNGATRIEKLGNKFKMVQNRVNELLGCTYRYEGALEEWGLTTESVTESTEGMTTAQEENSEAASRQSVIFTNLVSIIKGLKAALDIAWTTISSIARFVMDKITPGITKVGEGLLGVGGTIGDFLEKIAAFLKENDLVYKALTALHDAVQDKLGPAFESVGKFMDDLAGRKTDVLGFFEALDFSKIGKIDIQTFFSNLRTDAGTAIGVLGKFFAGIGVGAAKLLGFNVSLEGTEATFGAFSADDPKNGIGGFIQALLDIGGKTGEQATESINSLAKAGGILKEYWDMVIKGELTRSLRNTFIGFGEVFKLMGSDVNPIKQYFESEWAFGKAANVMGQAIDEVKEEVPVLSTFAYILNKFKNFFTFAWDILKFVGGQIKAGLDKWFQPMVDTIKNIVEKIKSADLDSLLQIGVLITTFTVLITILNLARLAGNLFKSFSWVGDELFSFLRSIRLRNYAGMFLEFALSFGIVIFALAKLTEEFNKNSTGMWAAVISLGIIMGGLVGLMYLIVKTSTVADTAKALGASGSVMILIGALGLMVAELYALAKMTETDLTNGVIRMLGLFVIMLIMVGAVNFVFNKMGGDKLPGWQKMAGFFAFVLALKTGAEILGELIGYSWDEIGRGLTALLTIAIILTGLSFFMKNIKLTSSVGLIALVGAIWLFVKFLDAIKDYDYDGIYRSLRGLMPIFVLIGILGVVSAAAGKGFWAVAATLAGVAFAMRSIVKAVQTLGAMHPAELEQGITALSILLGVLTVLTAGLLSYMAYIDFFSAMGLSRGGKNIVATFVGISVALLAIAAALKIVATIDPDRLTPAAWALGSLMAVLAVVCFAADRMQAKAGALIAMAAVIVTIGLTLWGISNIPWKKLAAAAGALATVLIGLGAAFWGINRGKDPKKIGQIILEFIEIAALVAGLVWALSTLAKYDPESLITAAACIAILSIVLVSLTNMLGVAESTSAKGKNVAKGIAMKLAPLAGLVLAVVAVAWALGRLLEVVGKNGITWEQMAAASLGMAVLIIALAKSFDMVFNSPFNVGRRAHDVGYIIKSVAAFATYAALMGIVIVTLGSLFSGIEEWSASWMGGTGAITRTFDLLILVGYKIGEFFSALGEGLISRAPQMGEKLGEYARNMTDFVKVFSDNSVDWDLIEKATTAIANCFTSLSVSSSQPVDVDKLGDQFTTLAKALGTFYKEINKEEIDVDKTKKAAEAISVLAAIVIPDTEGMDTNADNLGKLASGLTRLGNSLIDFSKVVSSEDFDPVAISAGLTSIQQLADIADDLDLSKFSGWDALTGTEVIGKVVANGGKVGPHGYVPQFTTETEEVSSLLRLAEELKKLGDYVTTNEINADSVSTVLGLVSQLAEAARLVPNVGGLRGVAAGDFSWSTLSTGLTTLAFQIKQASKWGPDIDVDGFGKVLDCITELGEVAKGLGSGVSLNDIVETLTGQDHTLSALAEDLVQLAPSLKNFIDTFEGYDTHKVGPAFSILRRLAALPQMFVDEGGADYDFVSLGSQLEQFALSFAVVYNTLGGLVTGESPVDDNVFQGILNLFSGIGEIFTQDTMTELTNVGTQLSAAVVEGFKINTVAVYDGVDIFISNLIGRLETEGNMQRMTDSGRKMSKKFADALHDDGDGKKSSGSNQILKDAADQVVDVVYKKLVDKTNYQKMHDAGAYLVQGLIDGMASKVDELKTQAQKLADAVNEKFTGVEIEHSPSKVWFGFGRYLVEGLIGGMQDSQNDAVYTAGVLASAINGEFSNGLGPSITPVVDLSGAYGQASRLNTMFDMSRASALAASMNINSQVTQMDELVGMTYQILGTIQNGSDLYLDDDILAGRINRRLGML